MSNGGPAVPEQDDLHWVGTWTTTPAPVEGVALKFAALVQGARLASERLWQS